MLIYGVVPQKCSAKIAKVALKVYIKAVFFIFPKENLEVCKKHAIFATTKITKTSAQT